MGPQLRHLRQIVRRGLIHPIQPVAPQQIRMRAPGEQRLELRIVMGEVVLRERHVGHTLGHVTLIFLGKRHLAVFPMPQCEYLGKITRGDQPRTRFRPPRQNLQIGIGTHIALIHARKTGMRLQCDLVEPIGQEAILVLQVLGEHTEDLLGQIHRGKAKILVKAHSHIVAVKQHCMSALCRKAFFHFVCKG